MKRLLVLVGLLGILGAAMLPGSASAHPLGNFTVNHFAAVDLAGNGVYVRYALDLAEIPTFQEGAEVRKPGFAAVIARSLDLRRRRQARAADRRLAPDLGTTGCRRAEDDALRRGLQRPGQGLATDVHGPRVRQPHRLARDRRHRAGRCQRDDELGAGVEPLERASHLPDEPPALATRRPQCEPSSTAPAAPRLRHPRSESTAAPEHENGGFESLIQRGDLSVGVILLSLLIAAFWGAVHALTPGHGKALVAGYLVGTKGKPRHAFLLGATVTATHTAGVFALGLVTLALSQFIVPDQLYPWLTLTSGLLVVVVGASVLRQRLRGRCRPSPPSSPPRRRRSPSP